MHAAATQQFLQNNENQGKKPQNTQEAQPQLAARLPEFADGGPQGAAQRRCQAIADSSPQATQLKALHDIIYNSPQAMKMQAVSQLLADAAVTRQQVSAFKPNSAAISHEKGINDGSLEPGRATPVVQGVFFDDVDKNLIVHNDYMKNRVPYDVNTNFSTGAEVTDLSPTLGNLWHGASKEPMRAHFKNGLNIPNLLDIKCYAEADAAIEEMNLTVSGSGTSSKLHESFDSSIRMATLDAWGEYTHPGKVPVESIPRPADLFAEAGDLDVAPEDNKVCALIALVKIVGADHIINTLGIHPVDKSLRAVVNAMHTYYRGENIAYDDLSSHVGLMGRFGLKIAYSGPCSWHYLHNAFKMELGEAYLFDIQGHSVMVRKIKEPKLNTEMSGQVLPQYYQTYSENWNFNVDHFTRDVLYIYGN